MDRNGYVPMHNRQYSQPRRDVAWDTVHCRNRRIFNDRTGLAAARNLEPLPALDLPARHGRRQVMSC